MSQQDKPNTAKQEGVGEYSVWWSKDNPTRQCTTHHNACNCREEKFQKLEAALKDAVEALEFYGGDNYESVYEDDEMDLNRKIDREDVSFAESDKYFGCAGVKARQALERIRKVLG